MKKERTYSWQSPEETAKKALSLSGYEFIKLFENTDQSVPIFDTLDVTEGKVEKGAVSFTFQPQEFHYNPIGTVHGGVISTLLDSAMGCTVHSVLEKGFAYTTLELKVNFIKAVTIQSGKMTATGKIIHVGRTTALLEASLTDENGKVFAHGTSTCLIIKL